MSFVYTKTAIREASRQSGCGKFHSCAETALSLIIMHQLDLPLGPTEAQAQNVSGETTVQYVKICTEQS